MNRKTRRPFILESALLIGLLFTLGAARPAAPGSGSPSQTSPSEVTPSETSSRGGLRFFQGQPSSLTKTEEQRSEIRVAGLARSFKRFDAIHAAAKKGDLSSIALMGNFYYWQLVKPNLADPIEQEQQGFVEAAKWFKQAAGKGHAESPSPPKNR